MSFGSHNDRFHGPEPVPGWLWVPLVRIGSHHPRSARSQVGGDAAGCVCPAMRGSSESAGVGDWVMGPVGLRMPRRTQTVKSVMTQWLSAAMPPATYALTCVTSRMPPVVLVSSVYLAGCVCLGMRTCPDM